MKLNKCKNVMGYGTVDFFLDRCICFMDDQTVPQGHCFGAIYFFESVQVFRLCWDTIAATDVKYSEQNK